MAAENYAALSKEMLEQKLKKMTSLAWILGGLMIAYAMVMLYLMLNGKWSPMNNPLTIIPFMLLIVIGSVDRNRRKIREALLAK
ncbi:MAG TPA: hypothetical protein PKA00_04675 [Saprospiraceae bacterium]|nr:hypothetical protein [Saprospiraceae bacterium]HMQ82175.1 hypothetical protein [Saprospiraceae bacterium]